MLDGPILCLNTEVPWSFITGSLLSTSLAISSNSWLQMPCVCRTHLHSHHRPEHSARLSGHVNNFTLAFALGWRFGTLKHNMSEMSLHASQGAALPIPFPPYQLQVDLFSGSSQTTCPCLSLPASSPAPQESYQTVFNGD